MVWVRSVIQRRKYQISPPTSLCHKATDALTDLRQHEGIQAGDRMSSVILAASYWNQLNIVLSPVFYQLRTNGRLDIGTSLAEFRRRRELVLGEY